MANQWSESQLKVLEGACNALFQAHTKEELMEFVPHNAPPYQKANLEKFITTRFSDIPGAIQNVERQFRQALSPDKLGEVGFLLSVLSTRAGSAALTGRLTPWLDMSDKEREEVFKSWAVSSIPQRRLAYKALVAVSLYTLFTQYEDIVEGTGYPAHGDPVRGLDKERMRSHYPYRFEEPSEYETDVLIVGSGAGGGVVASELSKKGWKVLVLDKGEYVKPEDMTVTQKDGLRQLYEGRGMIATEDGSLNILAGSTFGGGTTVNWCASLAPQHFVREEWAHEHGLRHFLSPQFRASIEAVQQRMGVSSEAIQHNIPNAKLIDGAIKLGYHVDNIPQNTNRHPHKCGFCSFGCYACEKQGGTVSWLKDAAERDGKFLVNATVEKLLFASSSAKKQPKPTVATADKFSPSASRRRCIGALVRFEDGSKVVVRAREAVVVSSGSLNSPAVLMRSGLKNPRIGRNLHLHPVSYITGYYRETINPWEGSIMTAVSTVAENRDGTHHGCKLEVNMSFAGGTGSAFQKWLGSKEHKAAMLQFNNSFTLLAIGRDRDTGRIILDKNGTPRVDYTLSTYDGLSILGGVVAGAEIHLVAGAYRISTAQAGVPDYYPAEGHRGVADPAWIEWLAKVKAVGIHAGKAGLGSAHQMGSCQMGTKPTTSVVDPRGRVWGTEGLYVADASVFPTASGVNPMITTMSVSHSIAQFIDEDLHNEAAKETRPSL